MAVDLAGGPQRLAREAESWPPPEQIGMERVRAIFRKHDMEFFEEHEG